MYPTFILFGIALRSLTIGGDIRSIGTFAGSVVPVMIDTISPDNNVAKQPTPEYHKYDTRNNQNTASSWFSLLTIAFICIMDT